MPLPVITGTLAALVQSEHWDFDPTRGEIHRFDFRGASRDQMYGLKSDYVIAGIPCQLNYIPGGTSSLEVNDSTNANPVDNWEVVGNEIQLDILQHPTILEMTLDTHDLRVLRQEFLDASKNWDDIYSQMHDTTNGVVLNRFYNLYLRGSTEYRRGQYVLKHTTNVSGRYSANISDTFVDCIYLAGQLVQECASSDLWTFPLPVRLQNKIKAATTALGDAPTNYKTGWLKSASTEATGANNRINIVTEYVLEQWSTDLYKVNPTAISP